MKLSPQLTRLLPFVSTIIGGVDGCSRVLENKYETVVAGRSMDWGFSFNDVLTINPPGIKMDGNVGENSVEWTSKYGSVVSSIIPFFAGYGDAGKEYGLGIKEGEPCFGLDFEKDGGADGINTEGLGAHLLELGEAHGTKYAEPSETEKINLTYFRWIRYVLDNFATVKEAVEGLPGLPGLSELRTIRDPVCEGATSLPHEEGIVLGGHMAIEDASGDSAVFEHVNGTWQVYHSRTDALVMTNDPPFQDQKKILAEYSPWGGEKKLPEELPGSVSSWDRFVRLEYFISHSPEPKDYAEVIANVRSFISSTNVPFGAPYGGGIYPTWWTSYTDLTNKEYYYDWVMTPNMFWVEVDDIDFDSLEEPLMLWPQNSELVGNVLCDFTTMDGEDPKLAVCEPEALPVPALGLRGVEIMG